MFQCNPPLARKYSVKSLTFYRNYSNTVASEDEINYSIVKLEEASFIKATIKSHIGYDYTIVRLDDITYQGHQFLANIRSDTIWNDVKEVSKKVGSNSLQAVSQIATAVITAIINNQLGFTP